MHASLRVCLAVVLAVACVGADVWPGFRGTGTGTSGADRLPVRWSEAENVAWSAKLPGYGQSSPVVWKDEVFVTAVAGEQREKGYVVAFDVVSGKEKWRHEFAPTQKAKWSPYISKAAPTPVVDEQGVYAFFEGGDLIALDRTGKVRWTRSLVKDYGEFQNNHGLAASPISVGDAIVVLIDDRGPSYMLAVDRATGKNLWKVDRPQKGSWTPPVFDPVRREIVVSSAGTVAGYDPKTGERRWEVDGLSGNTIPSATPAGDRILVGAGAGKGDPKGAAKSNCCIKISEAGAKAEVVWSADKASSSMASPVVHRGHAYFVSQAGVVYCLDLDTGKEKYAERIDGSCWATPIAAGDHIYFFGKDGTTTVLKAGPSFEAVATNRLGAGDGSPVHGAAAVDGAFFVRTGTTLHRIGK